MPRFSHYIGIDYSGAKTPTNSLPGLRVYMASGNDVPSEVPPPPSPRKYWTRRGLAEWLVATLLDAEPTIVGVDHAFSFPLAYFERHNLPHDWPAFLDDFCAHWPTDDDHTYVDFVRDWLCGKGAGRMGETRWRRLTEICAGGAKSPFHFDVQGSVAKSTHAGLPWLKFIRDQLGQRVHFWPFDGWQAPPDVHVIAEVYPSLWRGHYADEGRTPDQQDAYTVCRWMQETDQAGDLDRFLLPSLSPAEASTSRFEGWILGVVPSGATQHAEKNPAKTDGAAQALFADILRPKLDREKTSGGTYWRQLVHLHESLSSCPLAWANKLNSGQIRSARQIEKDEPTITYYLFSALSLATHEFAAEKTVDALFRKAISDTAVAAAMAAHVRFSGWAGLQFEALLTPTDEIRHAVRHQAKHNPVQYVRTMAREKAGVRFESATHLDVFIGDGTPLTNGQGQFGLGIEAKFTSDIDDQTTYAPHRNQLIRNIEVGNARFSDFAFLLVTPRAYRQHRSRFYVYKMEEYLGPGGAEAMNRDSLTGPGVETTCKWQSRLGWLDWEDLVATAFPSGTPAFNHTDAPALVEFLRARLLWPFPGSDAG